MDRCALFIDAGYALADGAMAVHGTRRRDSVSWDHAGLLKLLTGLARDRTGLDVLRCYWYEAAVEGSRTAEHDALADMPGLKLRLVNVRPGRREGIETQLRRDLLALAKNGAISDAFIASANENLAEIVTEVQDLGLRVVILHIASDGGWTVPQSLRQESDDLAEITGVHLRPFVDLIRGAEPASADEPYARAAVGSRNMADGGAPIAGAVTHRGLPAAALPAPGAVYDVPATGDYRQGAQPYADARLAQPAAQAGYPAANGYSESGALPGQPAHQQNGAIHGGSMPDRPGQNAYSVGAQSAAAQNGAQHSGYPNGTFQTGMPTDSYQSGTAQHGTPQHGMAPHGVAQHGMAQHGMAQPGTVYQHGPSHGQAGPGGAVAASAAPAGSVLSSPGNGTPGSGSPANSAPVQNAQALGGTPQGGTTQGGTAQGGTAPRHYQGGNPQNQGGNSQSAGAGQPGMPQGGYQNGSVQNAGPQGSYQNGTGRGQHGAVPNGAPQNGYQPGGAQPNYQGGWPQIGAQQGSYQHGAAQNGAVPGEVYGGGSYGASVAPGGPAGFDAAPTPGQHQQLYGAPEPGYFHDQPGAAGPDHGPRAPFGLPQPAPMAGTAFPAQAQYAEQSQPVAQVPAVRALQPVAVSLSEAVKAAHAEGFGFGESVGRDAPALWLDAVLARKPRMPSDLEARLLQGSALPIDSLLHDEVRHSLRRGFWDALENARR